MSCSGILYPSFLHPIAFSIGPLHIRWYALAYIAGVLLGWIYVASLLRKTHHFSHDQRRMDLLDLEGLITWIVLGILLGGRLGYVFFYAPHYYFTHPLDILKIWQGGMSFHGGLLGVFLAMALFSFKKRLAFFHVADMVASAVPIGLFLGRIANFVNGELIGRITHVPWGMCFPGEEHPRHPSQLYEALLEGLVLFWILRLIIAHGGLKRPGAVAGSFCFFYGLFRIFCENFRMPDKGIGFLFGTHFLTMGMVLSAPMVLLGLCLLYLSRKPT